MKTDQVTGEEGNECERRQIVVILTNEVKAAKVLSSVLRKVNVLTSYFFDLKSFWEEISKERPSLAIVDIKNLGEGDLSLKNHPLFVEKKLPLIFYYNEQSIPLLFSLPNMPYAGLIKLGEPLELELVLKTILEKLNENRADDQQRIILEQNLVKAKSQSLKFKEFFQGYQKEKFYEKQILDFLDSLKKGSSEKDFFDFLCDAFSNWNPIESFTVYELSLNGQKLISPTSRSLKYKKFPSLWLGQICSQGIELFAQNMAIEVSSEEFGLDYGIISIRGAYQSPDLLIFFKTPREFYREMDWPRVEETLENIYRKRLLQKKQGAEGKKILLQSWEFLSLLEQEASQPERKDLLFFDFDFSELLEGIEKNKDILFYWKSFFDDFLNSFLLKFGEDLRVALFGPQHLAVLAKRRDRTNEHQPDLLKELKNFGAKFPFWRYFEDSEVVLAEAMIVHVRMLPFSSTGYLKFLKQKDLYSSTKPSDNRLFL